MLHIASSLNDDNESVVSQRGDSLFTLLLFLCHIWLHSRGSSKMLIPGLPQYFPWWKGRSTPTGKEDGNSCLAWPWSHQYKGINLINIANLHYFTNIYVQIQYPKHYLYPLKKINTYRKQNAAPSTHLCSWRAPDIDSGHLGVFSGGVTEAQTPALSSHVWMEVTGSQTLSSLKGSSETEMEIVLLAMKPKGNKRRLFSCIIFLHGAGADKFHSLL